MRRFLDKVFIHEQNHLNIWAFNALVLGPTNCGPQFSIKISEYCFDATVDHSVPSLAMCFLSTLGCTATKSRIPPASIDRYQNRLGIDTVDVWIDLPTTNMLIFFPLKIIENPIC